MRISTQYVIINTNVLELKRIMSHYVIGYHDLQNNHYEICEYAEDAYSAIKQAREDLPDMKASPLSCEYCLKED